MATAAYDDIADWYEEHFLPAQRRPRDGHDFADGIGVDQALAELLGAGHGTCLEVGCGTGIYAARVQSLGWTPLGIDLSAGMLRHAHGRLPVARGDATRLPFASASVAAATAVMIHTDMPAYVDVLDEIHRVLVPGGRFVHIGVHPCFCGSFADRADWQAIVVRPGYLDAGWTPGVSTTAGELGRDGVVRKKVGAAHQPLASLLNQVTAAGFVVERFFEGAAPTPITFSFRATKPKAR